jgi:hypothetical protein
MNKYSEQYPIYELFKPVDNIKWFHHLIYLFPLFLRIIILMLCFIMYYIVVHLHSTTH